MKRPEKQHIQLNDQDWRKTAGIAFILAVLAFLPYAQTVEHDFIDFDDQEFVTENVMVRSGLTWAGIQWALTTFHAGNWLPLTWMSHMLDVSLFGMDAGRHHLMNACIHALSTALLFLALYRMTGAAGKSAFAAALFGIHPLHVESVAWVAERKDVLSGLFFMLVLIFYERYARRGGTGRYLLVVLLFALGLLSKSMLVTVPFVLLLLDVWPLGRTSLAAAADGSPGLAVPWARLVLEKAPLFLMAIAASAVTYLAQKEGGAMGAMERDLLSFGDRLANAAVAYAGYLGKTVWPSSLAIFYPHPGRTLPWGKVAGAASVLLGLLLFTLRQGRSRPFLLIGWLWYLGMLVPVIGLVQVGIQAQADRYTYLPMIGLLIMITWSAGAAWPPLRDHWSKAVSFFSGAVLLILLAVTTLQVGHWRNTVAVFQRAVEAAPDNWFAQRSLAGALAKRGLAEEAIDRYQAALRLRPRDAKAHNDLAVELAGRGRHQEAIGHYQEALRLRPDFPEALNNLGNALAVTGRRDEAIERYREAVKLRPGWTIVRGNLELLLAEQERSNGGRSKGRKRIEDR
ncbi:MAG: tetratricopeptide repeat protein [Nitrospirota bacterium]